MLPLLLEPAELQDRLGAPSLLIVDLSNPSVHAAGHIAGAVHLDYTVLVSTRWPVGGLLPDEQQLSRVFSSIGLTPETHVVAYDDEGGGKAGRLLWTLDVVGHGRFSLLNGGLHAWANEGHPLETGRVYPAPSNYVATVGTKGYADRAYILSRIGDSDAVLLDTRTREEFLGTRRFAAQGGHIPGAINMDWILAMDGKRNLRIKAPSVLRAQLQQLGVTPDREIIVYCQTHHRSSHTYVALKTLGYPRVRGYPGAWSEWGNLPDMPVELG